MRATIWIPHGDTQRQKQREIESEREKGKEKETHREFVRLI